MTRQKIGLQPRLNYVTPEAGDKGVIVSTSWGFQFRATSKGKVLQKNYLVPGDVFESILQNNLKAVRNNSINEVTSNDETF